MSDNCYPKVKGMLQAYKIQALYEENAYLKAQISSLTESQLEMRRQLVKHEAMLNGVLETQKKTCAVTKE